MDMFSTPPRPIPSAEEAYSSLGRTRVEYVSSSPGSRNNALIVHPPELTRMNHLLNAAFALDPPPGASAAAATAANPFDPDDHSCHRSLLQRTYRCQHVVSKSNPSSYCASSNSSETHLLSSAVDPSMIRASNLSSKGLAPGPAAPTPSLTASTTTGLPLTYRGPKYLSASTSLLFPGTSEEEEKMFQDLTREIEDRDRDHDPSALDNEDCDDFFLTVPSASFSSSDASLAVNTGDGGDNAVETGPVRAILSMRRDIARSTTTVFSTASKEQAYPVDQEVASANAASSGRSTTRTSELGSQLSRHYFVPIRPRIRYLEHETHEELYGLAKLNEAFHDDYFYGKKKRGQADAEAGDMHHSESHANDNMVIDDLAHPFADHHDHQQQQHHVVSNEQKPVVPTARRPNKKVRTVSIGSKTIDTSVLASALLFDDESTRPCPFPPSHSTMNNSSRNVNQERNGSAFAPTNSQECASTYRNGNKSSIAIASIATKIHTPVPIRVNGYRHDRYNHHFDSGTQIHSRESSVASSLTDIDASERLTPAIPSNALASDKYMKNSYINPIDPCPSFRNTATTFAESNDTGNDNDNDNHIHNNYLNNFGYSHYHNLINTIHHNCSPLPLITRTREQSNMD